MNNEMYQKLAERTEKFLPQQIDRLIHAQLGLASESGEFADALKKHQIYNKILDTENLKEELGDLLWYIALAANALGITIGDIMESNIQKLSIRYPEHYKDSLAVLRLDKENDPKV